MSRRIISSFLCVVVLLVGLSLVVLVLASGVSASYSTFFSGSVVESGKLPATMPILVAVKIIIWIVVSMVMGYYTLSATGTCMTKIKASLRTEEKVKEEEDE